MAVKRGKFQSKLSLGGTVVALVIGCIAKNSGKKKQGMVVEVTGTGHNRRFKVKWSDDKRTEETVRGLASAKAKEGKGSERDMMASNLMLVKCEDDTKNDEESEEEDKGNNMKVKTLKKIVDEYLNLKQRIVFLFNSICIVHRHENSYTGIEEDDGEIQHRKKADACIVVETKDVAKTHYATVLDVPMMNRKL